jgi:hypothetical protein
MFAHSMDTAIIRFLMGSYLSRLSPIVSMVCSIMVKGHAQSVILNASRARTPHRVSHATEKPIVC